MANRDEALTTARAQLGEISRRLRREWDERIAAITYAEHTLISAVADRDRATMVDVAQELRIDKSTASRQVGALERRGLLTRRALPGERRAQLLELTDEGERVRREASVTWDAAARERVADWSDADVEAFAALLTRYNQAR